jgi:hypothetical protein
LEAKESENQFFSRQNRIDIQFEGKITIENSDFPFLLQSKKGKISGRKKRDFVIVVTDLYEVKLKKH